MLVEVFVKLQLIVVSPVPDILTIPDDVVVDVPAKNLKLSLVDGTLRPANAAVEVRRALKAAVAENLSVEVYRSLRWSKSLSPTISDLRALRNEDGGGLGRMGARARRELLKDNSMMTEMERGDGVLPGIARARGRGRFNTAELSSLFRAAVMPSQLERTSRQGYFASWRTVVTWLLAHDAADQGLPMSKALLEARGTNHGAPPNRVVRRKHSQHLECYREPTQDVRP